MNDDDDLPMPAPMVQVTPEEAEELFGEPSLENPASVARAWVGAALRNDRDFFAFLCDNPDDWGLDQVREMLGTDSGLTSRVRRSEDRPDDLVTMMVVKGLTDQPVVVLGPMLSLSYPLTMVRQSDGTWRVWGFGGDIPTADEVFL